MTATDRLLAFFGLPQLVVALSAIVGSLLKHGFGPFTPRCSALYSPVPSFLSSLNLELTRGELLFRADRRHRKLRFFRPWCEFWLRQFRTLCGLGVKKGHKANLCVSGVTPVILGSNRSGVPFAKGVCFSLLLCLHVAAQSRALPRNSPVLGSDEPAETVRKVYQYRAAGEWEKAARLTSAVDPEGPKDAEVRAREAQHSKGVRVLGAALISPEMAVVLIRAPKNELGEEPLMINVAEKTGSQWKVALRPVFKRGGNVPALSDPRALAATAVMDRFIKNDWTGLTSVMHPAAMERFKGEMRTICDTPLGGGLRCRELFEVSDANSYDSLPAPTVVSRFFKHDFGTGGSASGYSDVVVHGIVPEGEDVAHVLVTFIAQQRVVPEIVTVRRRSGKWLGDSRLLIDRFNYAERLEWTNATVRMKKTIEDRDEELKRKIEQYRKLYEQQQKQR